MPETWKDVVGWEDVYSVSDVGRVRYEQDRPSFRYRVRAGDMVAQSPDLDGYLMVPLARLGQRDGRITVRVNRIVCEAFHGAPFSGAEANHKNGRRSDNAAENLEWTTQVENIQHAVAVLGRDYRGTKSARAKLTEQQVIDLRERAAEGETFESLGAAFGLTDVGAANVARGRTYPTAPGPISARRDGKERTRLGILNRAPDRHGRSALTFADVRAAREALARGVSRAQIGADIGLQPGPLHKLLRGDSWREAGGPLAASRRRR